MCKSILYLIFAVYKNIQIILYLVLDNFFCEVIIVASNTYFKLSYPSLLVDGRRSPSISEIREEFMQIQVYLSHSSASTEK